MKSSTMKTISIFIAVLGFIGSIIAGAKYKAVDITKLYEDPKFNLGLCLSCLIGTAILFIILYGIGAILENQEQILSKLYSSDKKSLPISEASTSKLNLNSISDGSDGWRCKKCGKTNPNSSTTCKDCGSYK